MPNLPFQPLFGRGYNTEKLTEKDSSSEAQSSISAQTPIEPQPQPPASTPTPILTQPTQAKKMSLKQKAVSSLGELALFVDKRKYIFIIVIIILILIAVIIVAKQQEQQRKKLKMMRRKLKRLMA